MLVGFVTSGGSFTHGPLYEAIDSDAPMSTSMDGFRSQMNGLEVRMISSIETVFGVSLE